MGKIYVVGLGPGSISALTIGAVDRIISGNKNFLRTENHPTIVRKMGSHGHDIGNHSYSHPRFPQLTTVQMQSQLSRTEKIIK